MDSKGAKRQPLRCGSQSSRGAGAEGLGLQWTSRRVDPRCAPGRSASAKWGAAGRALRGGGGAVWPRAFPAAAAKPDSPDEPGAPGPAFSLSPTSPRRPSVLSVAVSASRRPPAGCQASMIGSASDAILSPRTLRLCLSPGSLAPLHESSGHTRFPELRSQLPAGFPTRKKGLSRTVAQGEGGQKSEKGNAA